MILTSGYAPEYSAEDMRKRVRIAANAISEMMAKTDATSVDVQGNSGVSCGNKRKEIMIYAQFFQRSALDENQIVEACGDRAVVVYDARRRAAWIGQDAEDECLKRGYVAWQLFLGETFTRSSPISPINYAHPKGPDVRDVYLNSYA